MAITPEDVYRLTAETPDWTRSVRQLRMSRSTFHEAGYAVLEPGCRTMYGYPVEIDETVPHGTVHFEIPVPEPVRGLA